MRFRLEKTTVPYRRCTQDRSGKAVEEDSDFGAGGWCVTERGIIDDGVGVGDAEEDLALD